MRVIFAGGGTGGHLYPGLAIARALMKADHRVEPFFIGARRGVERDVLPQVGFAFELLDLHPFYRSRPWQKDRKSTRLNSSHITISYAVFCLKKKTTNTSSIFTH